ncbi:hypothetical protein [Paenibacillus pini]|uniref:Uncharacterized protein n=1 Tax=Paenibacillus pini JCM 16418 TaxID=1236976 RepID=W7YQC8_9BACL|nr:hypothetical protein [Paenibacillus pini]GAF06791.1 hypothetical protein JCM16418_773 [Paenibacillus pini JCM 16418]
MRFRWKSETSRTACISATVTRVMLRDLEVEVALDKSLPHYAVNPEVVSKLEHKHLLKDSIHQLKTIEESRQSGTSCRRQMRG